MFHEQNAHTRIHTHTHTHIHTHIHTHTHTHTHTGDGVVRHTPSPKQHLDSGKSIWVWSFVGPTGDCEGFGIGISNMSILPRANGRGQ